MKKVISFFCLITCTLIWGTTFIAQDAGMDNIGPFTFNSVRFVVGFLAVSPFAFLFEKKKITDQIKNNSTSIKDKVATIRFCINAIKKGRSNCFIILPI